MNVIEEAEQRIKSKSLPVAVSQMGKPRIVPSIPTKTKSQQHWVDLMEMAVNAAPQVVEVPFKSQQAASAARDGVRLVVLAGFAAGFTDSFVSEFIADVRSWWKGR